jgi:myosin I
VQSQLTVEQAEFARDALSKAIYDRMFTWVVQRINEKLSFGHADAASKGASRMNVIGVLDIYGFEIFQVCCGADGIICWNL